MKGCVQKCNVHLCFGGEWEILRVMKGCVQKCNVHLCFGVGGRFWS